MKKIEHIPSALYRWILREVWAYRLYVGGLLVLDLLSTPLELLTPLGPKIAADSVIGDDPIPGSLEVVLPAATCSKEATLVIGGCPLRDRCPDYAASEPRRWGAGRVHQREKEI